MENSSAKKTHGCRLPGFHWRHYEEEHVTARTQPTAVASRERMRDPQGRAPGLRLHVPGLRAHVAEDRKLSPVLLNPKPKGSYFRSVSW